MHLTFGVIAKNTVSQDYSDGSLLSNNSFIVFHFSCRLVIYFELIFAETPVCLYDCRFAFYVLMSKYSDSRC